jgi:hypothetical protein
MLTLCWSDGNTFLPLAFTLLSSEKEANHICPINPTTDKRSNSYKEITLSYEEIIRIYGKRWDIEVF